MNILGKYIKNYDGNKIRDEESSQVENEPMPKELLSAEKIDQENNSNYPNPELFRRLIEGTSFDRRTAIELKQEIRKEIDKRETVNTQIKEINENLPNYREPKQKIPIINKDLSFKRKKFINKKRESRLSHIVYEVIGNKTIKN